MGDRIYPDRPFLLQNLPEEYKDYVWVKAPTNDGHRYDLGDKFISFNVNAPVKVVVGYDQRFIEMMTAWLKNWTDANEEITDDAGDSFHLYQKSFPKGEIVLGNNTSEDKSLRLMYLILVKETEQYATLKP